MSSDDIPDPEEIDSLEDVKTLFAAMQQRDDELQSALESKYQWAVEDIITLEDRVEALQQENEALKDRVARLEQSQEDIHATMPKQQRDKQAKVRAILAYATNEATGGQSGVKVETGEATAAAGCSRNSALRLMDEIGAKLSWAKVRNPGGPQPKELRLAIKDRDVEELMTDVQEAFMDRGEAAA